MRRTLFLQALLAVWVLLPSCGNDDIYDNPTQEVQENNLVHIVLHGGSQSDSTSLRSYINDREVCFREGDSVSVFDGVGNRKFTALNNDSYSDFEGYAVVGNDYYILYPYQENATFCEGTINAVWPSTQTATKDSYDPLALLSVAHYDNEDNSFLLKNLGSLLKFEIINSYDKIVLRSIEKGEAIAGKVSVGGLAEGNLNYTTSDEESEITLLPSEDGKIGAGTYYIAFLPFATSGLYLDFYKDGMVWSKELIFSNLTRNKIYRVKNPEPTEDYIWINAVRFHIANWLICNNDNDGKCYHFELADNDSFGVHVLNGTDPNYNYEPKNVLYTYSKNSADQEILTTTDNHIALTDSEVSLLVYYPYKTPYDPAYELNAFAVQADQSVYENFKMSSFLNAIVKGCSSNNFNAELDFSPRTALVYVHITGSNANDIKQVTIPAMTKSSNSAAPSEPADVKMYKCSERSSTDDAVWVAFLPAQTFDAGTKISYTDGTQTFESDAIAGTTIVAGKLNTVVVK